MHPLIRWTAAAACLLQAGTALADYPYCTPVFKTPYPVAPDACGPGYYTVNAYGMVYGPNYYLVPPCPPFNGMLPGKQGQCIMASRGMGYHTPGGYPSGYGGQSPMAMVPQPPMAPNGPAGPVPPAPPNGFPNPGPPAQPQQYPTHPFVRGPRDFFMWSEALEEQEGRRSPTTFVP